jgi:hypothetical protein
MKIYQERQPRAPTTTLSLAVPVESGANGWCCALMDEEESASGGSSLHRAIGGAACSGVYTVARRVAQESRSKRGLIVPKRCCSALLCLNCSRSECIERWHFDSITDAHTAGVFEFRCLTARLGACWCGGVSVAEFLFGKREATLTAPGRVRCGYATNDEFRLRQCHSCRRFC